MGFLILREQLNPRKGEVLKIWGTQIWDSFRSKITNNKENLPSR